MNDYPMPAVSWSHLWDTPNNKALHRVPRAARVHELMSFESYFRSFHTCGEGLFSSPRLVLFDHAHIAQLSIEPFLSV